MGTHVLVPVDGSNHSEEALEFALDEHEEDMITILHVIDPMEGDYESDESTGMAVRRSEQVERSVESLLEDAQPHGDVEFVTREGHPADEIIACVDDEDIDQVVMGSRGLSGVKRLLLGSVAETVVRRADAPVNVVR
jgi:nucleotide-binding universal stress UspA family protein